MIECQRKGVDNVILELPKEHLEKECQTTLRNLTLITRKLTNKNNSAFMFYNSFNLC